MIYEYNIADDGVGYIDGDMNLSNESPIETEITEGKKVRKMNESQFRNLVYEMTLKMLDEQLNEDDPAATGGALPAGGAMDPNAATATGGAMPGTPAPAEDADTQGLPGKYAAKAKEFSKQQAQKVGDNTGGAPGFNPQVPDDDKKKQMAKQIAEHVIKQVIEQFGKKK